MRVLVTHGGYGGHVAGGETMATVLVEQLAAGGHDAVLAGSREALDRLPWRPDVVHAFDLARHDLAAEAERLARRCGAVFALTPASDVAVWERPEDGARLLRAADVVYVLTDGEARRLSSGGADPSRFVPTAQGAKLEGRADPEGFRDRHGLRGPLVLYLGRKLRSKGYAVLLEAAEAIWSDVPDAQLAFAGPRVDEDCEAVFARYADDRIVELGAVSEEEKLSALTACSLVCLPSTADVFPLVFAEAWHCGKPVVSGAFGGVEDVVRDGADGLVVAAEPEPVAAAVVRLLTDDALRAGMGERGLERARRELTWDRVTERVVAGYRQARAQAPAVGAAG